MSGMRATNKRERETFGTDYAKKKWDSMTVEFVCVAMVPIVHTNMSECDVKNGKLQTFWKDGMYEQMDAQYKLRRIYWILFWKKKNSFPYSLYFFHIQHLFRWAHSAQWCIWRTTRFVSYFSWLDRMSIRFILMETDCWNRVKHTPRELQNLSVLRMHHAITAFSSSSFFFCLKATFQRSFFFKRSLDRLSLRNL